MGKRGEVKKQDLDTIKRLVGYVSFIPNTSRLPNGRYELHFVVPTYPLSTKTGNFKYTFDICKETVYFIHLWRLFNISVVGTL